MAYGDAARLGPGGLVLRWSLGLGAALLHWSMAHRMNGEDAKSLASNNNQELLRPGVASGSCINIPQPSHFCGLSNDEMSVKLNEKRMGVANGYRAVVIHRYAETCSLYISHLVDLVSAETQVKQCCEGDCALLGPTSEDEISQWCRYARANTQGEECQCPNDIPIMIQGKISWPSSHDPQMTFNARSSLGSCVDVCFAKTVDFDSTATQVPLHNPMWPVVLLAVYAINAGIVHSNPVFCPNIEFLRQFPHEPCYQPGTQQQCGSDIHENPIATGHQVPLLLQKLECRELIFDGNHGGGTWIPEAKETGCWAKGRSPKDVFRESLELRADSYAELYWLTSENKVAPFSNGLASDVTLQTEMESCFGLKGTRLDFNPGTYSLLHHNCNKFSTEVMRSLDLPKFYPPQQKGMFATIAFSATMEESGGRRFLGLLADLFLHPAEHRSLLSNKCFADFYAKKPNCRRVHGIRYGDCPLAFVGQPMECYAWNSEDQRALPDLSEEVSFDGPANGVCRIPKDGTCRYKYPSVPANVPLCMAGTFCEEGKCQQKEWSLVELPFES